MATLVGKVGMVAKGDWNNSATYEALDVVQYNNGTYIAKQAVPANTLPTNTTYWQAALTSSIIGSTAITIPGTSDITSALAKMPLYIASQRDGDGAGLCATEGIYFIIATHNTDKTAYYLGVVNKSAGNAPVITEIAKNLISTGATNAGGTIVFNYNGSGLGSSGSSYAVRFLL